MAIFTLSDGGIDLAGLSPEIFLEGVTKTATPTTHVIDWDGELLTLTGEGFVFDGQGKATAGTVHELVNIYEGESLKVTGLDIPAAQFVTWAVNEDIAGMKAGLFAGNDQISGGLGGDTFFGGGGNDTLNGGGGDDVLTESAGANRLRGEDGADSMVGGADFDDIHGNMGADTATGGQGDDWVVGGKDNDLLFGDAGGDIVHGNLGNDTCDGGDGVDVVRGGQGDDVVRGGAGGDFVSGDRGSDTITGGAGADTFNTFGDAGIDRVMDFNLAEGDRVVLETGTQYTLSQAGADTVISMVGGGEMTLVGVSLSSLTPGWIVGG